MSSCRGSSKNASGKGRVVDIVLNSDQVSMVLRCSLVLRIAPGLSKPRLPAVSHPKRLDTFAIAR